MLSSQPTLSQQDDYDKKNLKEESCFIIEKAETSSFYS